MSSYRLIIRLQKNVIVSFTRKKCVSEKYSENMLSFVCVFQNLWFKMWSVDFTIVSPCRLPLAKQILSMESKQKQKCKQTAETSLCSKLLLLWSALYWLNVTFQELKIDFKNGQFLKKIFVKKSGKLLVQKTKQHFSSSFERTKNQRERPMRV